MVSEYPYNVILKHPPLGPLFWAAHMVTPDRYPKHHKIVCINPSDNTRRPRYYLPVKVGEYLHPLYSKVENDPKNDIRVT